MLVSGICKVYRLLLITCASGVGIVGKEGKQASLAADFSVTQFSFLTKLLVWHGRNSYKRSAKLSQFVIHRGVIMSVCQVMFSIASRFGPNALYRVSCCEYWMERILTWTGLAYDWLC